MTRHNEATSTIPDSAKAMLNLESQSIDTFFDGYTNWLGGWSRVQEESLRFLRDRVARDVDAVSRLAACKTPVEAFELQMRFARDAISDYVAESRKMTALLNPMAAQSLAALTGTAK